MSSLVKSAVGSFVARSGLSMTEFVGVVYIATVTGAEVLGTYALFEAVFVVATLLVNLGIWEASIKRIAEGESQGAFLAATLLMRLTLFAPVALVVVLFRAQVAAYVGTSAAIPFILGTVLVVVVSETMLAGLHGTKQVGRAETSQFFGGVVKLLTWVVLLSLGYGLVGLFVGLLVGRLLEAAAGAWFLTVRPRTPTWHHVTRLTEFSKYSWLSSVRNRAWIWTDTLILGFFVAPQLVGVYELSWRLSAAFFLLASAISSVLYANVDSILRTKGRAVIQRVVNESLVYTGIIAIPGLAGGFVLAEAVLSAFGPEFLVGYPVLVLLVLARLCHCYEIVFSKVINALDRPDLMFRVNGVFVVLNVVGNVVGIATLGWVGAAVATAFSMGVRTALAYGYLETLIDVVVPRREIILEGVAAVIMGATLLFAGSSTRLTVLELAGVITGGALLYGALVLLFVPRVRSRVQTFVSSSRSSL